MNPPAVSPIPPWWLPLDPTNVASPVLDNASVRKLIRDSAEATSSLKSHIDDARNTVKALDGGKLRIDARGAHWLLLCRQLRIQLRRERLNCIKLVEYILRLHATLAARGDPVIMEPLPEAIANYVDLVGVRARQG